MLYCKKLNLEDKDDSLTLLYDMVKDCHALSPANTGRCFRKYAGIECVGT